MEKGYRASAVLSLAVCLMFFLYAPLELYFTNKDEFWYDIWVLLPVMVCVFLIFTGIYFVGFWVLHKHAARLFQVGEVFLFILFVCSYVQGNYLIGYLPVFDGRSIDWSQYAAEGRTQSVILWIVVTVIVILAVKLMRMERMHALIQVVSICMVLMFVLTLSTLCITNHGLESKTNICVTTDYEMTMSTNQNCIILLLDALDGGAFSDIVVGNDELESIFDDFTYYDNTVSAYPSTTYNVPFILSGMWFENQMTSNQYFESVLTSSPLFAELEKREYVIDLYETDMRIDESTGKRFENIGRYTKKISSFSSFARWQILLTGMKYAPFDLKRFSFVNPNAFEKLRVLEGDSEAYHDSNKDFYNLLVEEEL